MPGDDAESQRQMNNSAVHSKLTKLPHEIASLFSFYIDLWSGYSNFLQSKPLTLIFIQCSDVCPGN